MKETHISQVDTVFVNGNYPIEMLLYFKNRLKTSKIRQGLKSLSAIFWPVFGYYENGLIRFNEYNEDACFIEKQVDEDFNPDSDYQQLWETFSRVNPAPLNRLFFLSALQFNNGTVLIPKMNHLAGDGYSYFYFMSVLAALSRPSRIPFKKALFRKAASPHHHRTALKTFSFAKADIEAAPVPDNFTIRHEKIPKDTIHAEIKKIQTGQDHNLSANDLMSAMIVKNTVEHQAAVFTNEISLTIPIDVRRQVKSYGRKFFGNGLMFHSLTFSSEETQRLGIRGMALKIRHSLPLINDETYRIYLDDLESLMDQQKTHTLKPYDPDKGCLVTNLTKMPVHQLDFGTGYPEYVFPITIGRNSAAILADDEHYILRLVH